MSGIYHSLNGLTDEVVSELIKLGPFSSHLADYQLRWLKVK